MRHRALSTAIAIALLVLGGCRDREGSAFVTGPSAPGDIDSGVDGGPAIDGGVDSSVSVADSGTDAALVDAGTVVTCPACTALDACHVAACVNGSCVQSASPDGTEGCAPDSVCVGGACVARGCGDGYREPGPVPDSEGCDDGNQTLGDGCDTDCVSEVVTIDTPVDDDYASVGTDLAQNVGVDGQNRALVVYRRRSGTHESLHAKRVTRYGAPIDAVPLTMDADLGLVPTSADPTVVGLKSGGWVVAWTSTKSGSHDVVFRIVLPDGSMRSLIVANRFRTGTQWDVELVALESGFVVGWSDLYGTSDDTGGGVVARVFTDAGVALTQDIRVATDREGSQGQLSLGAFGQTWLAAWETANTSTDFLPEVRTRTFVSTVATSPIEGVLPFGPVDAPDVVGLPHTETFAMIARATQWDPNGDPLACQFDASGNYLSSLPPADPESEPTNVTFGLSSVANGEAGVAFLYENDRRGRAQFKPTYSVHAPSESVATARLSNSSVGNVSVVADADGVWLGFEEDRPEILEDVFSIVHLSGIDGQGPGCHSPSDCGADELAGSCWSFEGHPWCFCANGYAPNYANASAPDCDDINECANTEACSSHGTCTNVTGSFHCACVSGWKGTTCGEDIDECAVTSACSSHGTCTDSDGSFSCACNDHWVGPTCAIADCGALTSPANGAVATPDGTIVTKVATYSCESGYQRNGDATRTCGADTKWSGSAPTCDANPGYCPPAPSVTNAGAATVSGGIAGDTTTSLNATAAYACDVGYVKSGSDALCKVDASWSTPPTCTVGDCGALTSPANGYVTGGTTYQQTATYVCNGGYETTSGSVSRTCQADLTWSGTPAVCSAKVNLCGAPPTLANASAPVVSGGIAGGSTYSLDAIAAYTCNGGYSKLRSDPRCQASASWSFPPQCDAIASYCPAAPTIANANLQTVTGGAAGGGSTSVGATAAYLCSIGYEKIGANPVCQSNATWSALPTCSLVDCGAPPATTNGTVSTPNGTTYNKTASYICNAGYVMSGSSALSCLANKSWSGSAPTCDPIATYCSAPFSVLNANPPTVSGGVAGGTTSSLGATAAYTCRTGYLKSGSDSVCQANMSWSARPTCTIADCGAVTAPANGTVSTTSGTIYGSVATYACSAGYALTGSSTRTCEANQSWTGSAPTCTAVANLCAAAPSIANATGPTVSGGIAGGSTTSMNATATYTCSVGYAKNTSDPICQSNGTWSTSQSCVAIPNFCPAPPTVANASTASVSGGVAQNSTTSFGATAAYTCNTGYVKSGTNPTCQSNGTWSAAPTCVPDPNHCPTAPSVTNATTPTVSGGIAGGSTTSMNATAAYTCNTGYVKSGSNAVCWPNKAWSPAPTCALANCGTPAAPTNGTVSTPGGVTYNQTATYACNAGYALSGSASRTCQADQAWSGSAPTCVAVVNHCSAAPVVANAGVPSVTGGAAGGTTTSVGATAAYACNAGYSKSGSDATCQSNGTWSTAPTCAPTASYCPTAPSVTNSASVAVSGGIAGGTTTSLNATANYTCTTGYVKTGSDAVCQSNASWSTPPTCSIANCGAPAAPTNGTVATPGGTTYNQTATYACSAGYALSGTATRTCQANQAWSGSAPTCVAVSSYCAVAPTVTNAAAPTISGGAAGGATTSLGATAAYTCNAGYTKTGSNATCQSNGTWSTAPTCTAITSYCPAAPMVTNSASVTVSGGAAGGATTSLNATANYTCTTGYVKTGSDAVCQSNATWSTPPTCPIANCGALANPTNGSVSTPGGTTYNQTATYACNAGYALSGASTRACQANQTWSGSAATCVAVASYCPAAPSVTNALAPTVSGGAGGGATTSVGATAAYTCSPGYTKSGSDATCQSNGTWSAIPMCAPTASYCPAAPGVTNASSVTVSGGIAGGSTTSLNATAAYACTTGYVKTGSDAVCQSNASWSTPPTCPIANCGALTNPTNGSVSTPSGTTYNQTATYACNAGYAVSGSSTRTCQANQTWSGSAPTCAAIATYCPAAPTVTNAAAATVSGGAAGGTTTSLGATAAYACNAGYTKSGSDATCQSNGTWSTTPTCTPTPNYCPAAPSVSNASAPTVSGGVAGGATTSLNATAAYTCTTGYVKAGSNAVCQSNATWSASPTCAIANCGALANPANGTVSTPSGTTYNQTATYACNAGYSLSGSSTRTCQADQLWSAIAPTCVAIASFCPAAPSVTNAGAPAVSGGAGGGSTTSLGATAAYTCTIGYVKGGSDSVCQSNATWSALPTCSIANCGALTNPTNGTVSTPGGTTYNQTATYACGAGYAITSGSSTRSCQANQTWSGTPATCGVVSNFCGTPATVANSVAPVVSGGLAGGATNSLGATATYSCYTGFAQSGSNATCQANATWSAPPTCVDVNECATNNGNCSPLVTCTNTPGSRTCGACPAGYYGDGITCTWARITFNAATQAAHAAGNYASAPTTRYSDTEWSSGSAGGLIVYGLRAATIPAGSHVARFRVRFDQAYPQNTIPFGQMQVFDPSTNTVVASATPNGFVLAQFGGPGVYGNIDIPFNQTTSGRLLEFRVDRNGPVAMTVSTITIDPTAPLPQPTPPAAATYQMSTDFSSSQGNRGWYYRYEGSASGDMTWQSANNRWVGNAADVLVGANWFHPGMSVDSIAKWVAPASGRVRITGTVRDLATAGGDGVTASVFKNGNARWVVTVANGDSVGRSHDLTLEVDPGDQLFFRIGRNGTNSYDTTGWDPKIQFTPTWSGTIGFDTTQSNIGPRWNYQYVPINGGSAVNMPSFSTSNQTWIGNETYLLVGRHWQHPGVNSNVVRAWTAPYAGQITISGIVSDDNPGCGDGVNPRIVHNGTVLWSPLLANGSGGVSHSIPRTVAAGDSIWFLVNKRGDDTCDTTAWDPTLTYP